jgi:hypothetical protein
MKIFKFFLSVCLFATAAICSQEICKITSYEDFPWRELGSKNTDQKIFMFDIDGTLLRTDVLSTAYAAITTQPYESFAQIWSYISTREKKGVLDLGTRYEQSSLIDDRIPHMVDTLIGNGHIVWNYTNVYTGKLYDTTYEEQIAYKLDRLNIKRSPILVDNGAIDRIDFPAYEGVYPVFYKGILLNAKKSKSKVFEYSFLPWLQSNVSYQSISHLIYIDDLSQNVYDIGKICEHYKINYKGFICCFE